MPDMWLDVDSAISEAPVNLMPLVDDTDFKTVEDAVAYNASGMDLRWNFVTSAGAYTSTAVTPTTGGSYDWTHQGDGMYSIEIPASGGASINNDTEGVGWFSGKVTGVLPFRGPTIGFRAAALNDALIDGGDNLDVNVTQLGGDTQSATDLKDFADAGYDPSTNKVQGVVLVDTVTTTTTATNLTNAPTSGDFTATMKTSIGTAVAASAVASVTGAVGSVTATVSADVVSISGSSTAANNAEIVFDTDFATNYNTTVDKWNVNLVDISGSAVSAMTAQLGVNVVAMNNNVITASVVNDGTITAGKIASDAFTAAKFASDVTTEFQSGLATSTALGTVDTVVDSILAAIGTVTDISTGATLGANLTDINSFVSTQLDAAISTRASQTSVTTIDDLLDTEIAALTTELAKVPKSDSTVTWNATALASIQAEANDALIANNLDHLVLSAVDTDFATTVHLNSVIGHLADAGTSATFDRTTDALEVLGAATAPSAASIADAVWTEAVADHSGVSGSTAEALAAAGGAGDPWITALPGSYSSGQAGYILGTNLNATVSSRATQTSVDTIDDLLDTEVASLTTELAKVPKSDGSVTWNATALASINTQCDTALSDYDAPTNTEMVAAFTEIKGATWATTDTLEAIRDRGDEAWTTATGFSTHSASDVWAAGTRTLTAGTNIQLPSNGLANVTAWTVAITGNITGNVSGSVGSVTGAINTSAGTITTLDALDTAQDTQHGTTQTAIADLPTNSELAAAIITGLTTALTEGYRSTGATGSVRDILYELLALLANNGIVGTTMTTTKLNKSTTAKTYTLNDGTTPTAIEETT